MRYIALLALLLHCLPCTAAELEYVAEIPVPELQPNGQVSAEGASFPQVPGEPNVPCRCYHLVLPFGEGVNAIEVKLEGFTTAASECDIPCVQQPSPIGAS